MTYPFRVLILATMLAAGLGAVAQPSRVACQQWDQSYVQSVTIGMIGGGVLALVLALSIAFIFGRHAWWAASARSRIWVAALGITFPLAELAIVVSPRVLGFGKLLFTSIDPQYARCRDVAFGGVGLLGGTIGQNVAAYGQWQAISALLFGACAVGGMLAWVVSEGIARSRGLETIAQGGEA